jgi:hypothetical protein
MKILAKYGAPPKPPISPTGHKGLAKLIKYLIEIRVYKRMCTGRLTHSDTIITFNSQKINSSSLFKKIRRNFLLRVEEVAEHKSLIKLAK